MKWTVEAVDNDFIGVLKADPSITLLKRSLPTVAILRFNHLQPPFNNVLMRRAVLASINQTDYMTAINGTGVQGILERPHWVSSWRARPWRPRPAWTS